MHNAALALLACACLLAAVAQAGPGDDAAPAAGTEIVHPVDNAIMVWAPRGEFTMGMDQDEADAAVKALGYKGWEEVWAWEWFPRRKVYVPGFFIDKYEVTRRRWERFVAATDFKSIDQRAKSPAEKRPGEFALYPIARVRWDEAQKCANWAGKQLPSEAQWEKAARGADGRLYPWGNEPPTEERGVFVDLKTRKHTMFRMVGSKPAGASPYGCMDMAGNVYEWTREWLEPYPNNPERKRMLSYTGHKNACLRGGSFYHGTHAYIAAKRFGFKPDETYYHVGFRTVWEPPAGYFDSKAFEDARSRVKARKQEIEGLRSAGNPRPPANF